MICPICEKKIKDDSKFCGKCGCKIPRCPTCGKVIDKQFRFCIYDGTPISEEVLMLLPNALGIKKPEEDSSADKPVHVNDGDSSNEVPMKEEAKKLAQKKMINPEQIQNPEREQNPEQDQNQLAGVLATSSITQQNMEPKSHFCMQCGKRFEEDGQMICPECRQESVKVAESVPVLMKTRFCVECGKPCYEGESLCVACQEKLYASEESKKKSGFGKIVVGALCTLLLALGGLVIYMIMNDGFSTLFSQDNQVESVVEETESSSDFESDSEEETSEEESTEEETETETEAQTQTETETEENNTTENSKEGAYFLSGSDSQEPDEFDDTKMLNEIEKANLDTMMEREDERTGTVSGKEEPEKNEYADAEEVNVGNQGITDISPYVSNANLEKLISYGNPLEDFTPITDLKNLKGLDLSNTGLTNIDFLSGMTQLEEFWIGENAISDISVVQNFTNLKTLDFWYTDISDISVFSKLSKLENVYMSYSNVTTLKPLMDLPNLKILSISGLTLPRAEYDEFVQKHPDCVIYQEGTKFV